MKDWEMPRSAPRDLFIRIALAALMSIPLCGAELIPHHQEAIEKAMRSVTAAAEKVQEDPARPAFHLLPPANWMNDPNGPLFHNGWYHLFYQHNPYGDNWGHMHWGHFRSRDLVTWEHQPIALWPSLETGEEHVFSGCAAINGNGQPMLFYTSIKKGRSAGEFAEQWAAISTDPELVRWEKHPDNPVLAESIHGGRKIWDWRDPFVFKFKGEDYMVLGGNLNKGQGGQAVVTLYKAKNEELTDWEYKGILFTHPDPRVGNIECPNFFELDGHWVLILSPHRRVEYFIGSFDGEKFTPKHQGLMDHSGDYYAPNSMVDAKGRRILWGWIRGFKDGQGWNGCLTLPRLLTVDERGNLWQRPLPEFSELERKEVFNLDRKLPAGQKVACQPATAQLEIAAEFVPGNKCGVELWAEGEERPFRVWYESGKLRVGDQEIDLALHPNDTVVLNMFVDHSVVEVYANAKVCFSKVFYAGAKPRVEFVSGDDQNLVKAAVWELGSIWKN